MPNIKMFGSPTRLGNGQVCLVVIGCQVPQSRGSSTRRYLGFERWNAVDMAKLWRSFCGVLLYICIQCVWSLGIWEFFLEVGSSQLTGRRFAQFLGQIQAEYGQYAQCERFMLSSAESGAPGRCIGTQEPDMAVKLVTLVGTGWTRDIIQLIFVKWQHPQAFCPRFNWKPLKACEVCIFWWYTACLISILQGHRENQLKQH